MLRREDGATQAGPPWPGCGEAAGNVVLGPDVLQVRSFRLLHLCPFAGKPEWAGGKWWVASGWCRQLLSREWSWELPRREGGWAVLSGFCLPGDGAGGIPCLLPGLAPLPEWEGVAAGCRQIGMQ